VPGGGSQRLGQTKGPSGTGAGGGPSVAADRGIERGRTEHGDVRAGLGGGMAASGSAGRRAAARGGGGVRDLKRDCV
jgi:hypothetical protein